MANRLLPQKLVQDLRSLARRLNSATNSISTVDLLNVDDKTGPETTSTVEPPSPKPRFNNEDDSIIDVHDHKKLFAQVSTPKLLHAAVNLHLASIGTLVDFGTYVMKSRLMEPGITREAIVGTIRHTFYKHFCAGETTEEAKRCVLEANEAGLRGMLVYAVEHTDDNLECDRNLAGFIQTVETAKSLPPSSVSFAVAKITAICPMRLLKRVSDLLRWQQRDPSFKLPWKLNTLPIFSDNSPLYHTLEKPAPLSPEEEIELELGHQRLLKLCQICQECEIPLAIDAEDTIVQPALDYMTYSSAILYNTGDRPIVYNTMQAYLKDARERLGIATSAAEKLGVPMGFKLVRGAYMASESKLANLLGYESPIHNSIQDTHACYNDCASFMLEKIANGSRFGIVFATHNIESGQLAAKKARDLGISKDNERFEFAQLYGMSEALTFGLRNAGFKVSKYMPYGPIDMVMPYLLRRAEENKGFLSASNFDRQLMRKELKRRFRLGN